MNRVPVIDIFAGPGGLGEGFSALGRHEGNPFFKISLSIEKEATAHQTLQLRAFFRQFEVAPPEYYDHLRGEIDRETLFALYPSEAIAACEDAWKAELGTPDADSQLDKKIRKAIGGEKYWVLIGGPPCQAYSIIGRARNTRQKEKAARDIKNILYLEYLKIVAQHRPAVFVMENVKGMLSSRVGGNPIFEKILSDLQRPTKEVSYKVFSLVKSVGQDIEGAQLPKDYIVECEKYGIPQARHRVILLGVRQDLASRVAPGVLEPCHESSVEDVLTDLPKLRSGLSRNMDDPMLWMELIKEALSRRWVKGARKVGGDAVAKRLIEVLTSVTVPQNDRGKEFIPWKCSLPPHLSWWYHDSYLAGVCNHTARTHIIKDIYRYAYASCFAEIHGYSPLLSNYPPDLLPNHENAISGHFNDRFRVQVSNKPSRTVTSHISKDGHYYIHPDPTQLRSLTVREAARLQTFPDNYFFCGNRTQQYVQVGNAVPPYLAYKVATIVRDFLQKV